MSRSPYPKVLDLDKPQDKATTVVVRYRGVVTAVSRERLLELLRHEEVLFSGVVGGAVPDESPAPLPTAGEPAATSLLEPGPISHASLSTRIRKIYNYSLATRSIRPTHAGLLIEVLTGFDWQIPHYPNTQLERHLAEILHWSGVSAPLRGEIKRFLERYLAARAQ